LINSVGQTQKNIPLVVSSISKETGIDIRIVNLYHSISLLEENLTQIKTDAVDRPFPDEIVESLNNIVQYNQPNFRLISASQRFPTSQLLYILSKVREELIKGLQHLNRNSTSVPILTEEVASGAKLQINVFVTYAWENEEHNEKVVSFVDFLRKKGYNASMDKLKTQEETATNLNRMMVSGLQDADKIIVILSPKYKEKADAFQGGVGTEFQIILEEIKTKANKFIFVTFGNESFNSITPTGILGREVLDLKKDQDENEFNVLYSKLQSKNIIQFSPVEELIEEIKVVEIKPFKL
jgi:hypothetical protein